MHTLSGGIIPKLPGFRVQVLRPIAGGAEGTWTFDSLRCLELLLGLTAFRRRLVQNQVWASIPRTPQAELEFGLSLGSKAGSQRLKPKGASS